MAEEKDWWLKSEIIAKIISALLIPVVIVSLGYWVNKFEKDKDRVRADEDAMMNRITTLSQDLASDKPIRRKLALKVAAMLSKSDRLPPEMMPIIFEMLEDDPSPAVASAAGETAKQIVETQKSIGNNALAENLGKSIDDAAKTTRAFIQIPDNTFNTVAAEMKTRLEAQSFSVPGIENVGLARSPNVTEVRFTNKDDEDAAKRIIKALKDGGQDPKEIPVRIPGNGPGILEVWFGKPQQRSPVTPNLRAPI